MSATHTLTLAFAVLLASACSDASAGAGGQDSRSAALSCTPGEPRACPCAGAVTATITGMQTCDPSGRSFGACVGCPAAQAPVMPAPGTAGTPSSSMPDAGGQPPSGNAGNGADAGDDAQAPSLDQAGAVPGTSCGVGLPTLCPLESEKCCARSLDVDTCVPAANPCTCELPGCTVMEAHCDGPEDCNAGEVCCGTLDGGSGMYVDFVCSAQCAFQQNQREACHDGETECPGDFICANSQLLTNVQVCIDPASIEQ